VLPRDAGEPEKPEPPERAPSKGEDERPPDNPTLDPKPETPFAQPPLSAPKKPAVSPGDKVLRAPPEFAIDQEGAITRAELRVKTWDRLTAAQKKWVAGRAAWECQMAVGALRSVVARVRLSESGETYWGRLITALEQDAQQLERDGSPGGGGILPVLERLGSAEKLLLRAGFRVQIAN
jgi:hypothetical protein